MLNNPNAIKVQPKSGRLKTRGEAARHHCQWLYLTGTHQEGRRGTRGCARQPSRASASAVHRGYERLNSAWFPLPRHSLYIQAERPTSYNQHMCLEFHTSRNPASRPSESNDPSSTRTTAHLSAFQERKPENLFQTRGHICIPDTPPP